MSALGVTGAAAADALGCATYRCGLLADGAYAHLVIGTLTRVGSAADLLRVYHWAKVHGYWKSLPNSPAPYVRDIKLVTIRVASAKGARTVTVFMQQAEYAAAPYVVGDLVRYSPHDLAHESPQGDADALALYRGLTGCVRRYAATATQPVSSAIARACLQGRRGSRSIRTPAKPCRTGRASIHARCCRCADRHRHHAGSRE